MRIGQVAKEAGVTVDTVRFYERSGVLPRSPRTESGYRDFPSGIPERILLARKLQSIGLTLDEIVDALRSHDAGDASCESDMWRLERALKRIDERIAEIETTRGALTAVMKSCRSGTCGLATLTDSSPTH